MQTLISTNIQIPSGETSARAPEHEFTEPIALHQAVEQVADLFGLPDELALDRWQYEFVRGDTAQSILDCATLLVHMEILQKIGKGKN